jgi:hypothetical protein
MALRDLVPARVDAGLGMLEDLVPPLGVVFPDASQRLSGRYLTLGPVS